MITPFDPELDERVCCISADDYENTLKATDYILDKVIKDPEGQVSRNLMYSGGTVDNYSRQSHRGDFGNNLFGLYSVSSIRIQYTLVSRTRIIHNSG